MNKVKMIVTTGIATWACIALILFSGANTALRIANDESFDYPETTMYVTQTEVDGGLRVTEIYENDSLVKTITIDQMGRIIESK